MQDHSMKYEYRVQFSRTHSSTVAGPTRWLIVVESPKQHADKDVESVARKKLAGLLVATGLIDQRSIRRNGSPTGWKVNWVEGKAVRS